VVAFYFFIPLMMMMMPLLLPWTVQKENSLEKHFFFGGILKITEVI
jgi:hypothetical protein